MSPTCSCCSDLLIRHIRQGSLYWWCHSCWTEMPNLEEICGKSEPIVIPEAQPALFATLQEQLAPAKRPVIDLNRPFAHREAA